jgi:hypothetical protein
MPSPKPGHRNQETPPAPPYNFLAGFLSYLIPGLGQIYEGRVGKGLLFLACIYSLFGFGMYMGEWSNVYIPCAPDLPKVTLPVFGPQTGTVQALYHRPQYCAQFWAGVVSWPAIWQYKNSNTPVEDKARFSEKFERQPKEEDINKKQTNGDRTWDLAWVYTVIAGVLNIMVIYDAAAGPAFRLSERMASEGKPPNRAAAPVATA